MQENNNCSGCPDDTATSSDRSPEQLLDLVWDEWDSDGWSSVGGGSGGAQRANVNSGEHV